MSVKITLDIINSYNWASDIVIFALLITSINQQVSKLIQLIILGRANGNVHQEILVKVPQKAKTSR